MLCEVERLLCGYSLYADPTECKLSTLRDGRDTKPFETKLIPHYVENVFFFCQDTDVESVRAQARAGKLEKDPVQALKEYICIIQGNYVAELCKKGIASRDILAWWDENVGSRIERLDWPEIISAHEMLLRTDQVVVEDHLSHREVWNSPSGWLSELHKAFENAADALDEASDLYFNLYQPTLEYAKRIGAERASEKGPWFVGFPIQINIEFMDFMSHLGTAAVLMSRKHKLVHDRVYGHRIEAKDKLIKHNASASQRHAERCVMDMLKSVIATMHRSSGTAADRVPTLSLRHKHCHTNASPTKKNDYLIRAIQLTADHGVISSEVRANLLKRSVVPAATSVA